MTEAESPPAGGGAEAPAEAVCVAVNIRPLVGNELVEGCKEVLRVTPGEPQARRSGPFGACTGYWRLYE